MVTLEMESAAVVPNVLIVQILNSASQILVQIILHEPLKAYKFQYLTKTFQQICFQVSYLPIQTPTYTTQ